MSSTFLQPVTDATAQAQLAIDSALASRDNTIINLQKTIDGMRPTYIFGGLHRMPMTTTDRKQQYMWIQPSNVGNSGGAAPVPHGSSIWTPGSPTNVQVFPRNIDNIRSDNFFYYMPLPLFPFLVAANRMPTKFKWKASNFAAASLQDWNNSQQFENQVELIFDGFCRNMAWRINPLKGLGYFDKANDVWKDFFDTNGKRVIVDLSKPTSFESNFTIDYTKNTVTHEDVTLNNVTYHAGITQLSPPAIGEQFSTSVQFDGKALAPAYTALFDGHEIHVQ